MKIVKKVKIERRVLILFISGFTVLVIGIGIGRYVLPPQSSSVFENQPEMVIRFDGALPLDTIWTCSMHPQVQRLEPGQCPICGMDLIALQKQSGAGSLALSESAKALARIETTPVKREFPTAEIRMVGSVDYDETRVRSITARFPARIDRLYVNFTGIKVQRQDHLAEVYSPELLTAQSELLTALKYGAEVPIIEAAREKLRLWDLLPEQIKAIEQRGIAEDRFELKAPLGGVVIEKHVKEGDYVQMGQSLFKIADLSRLWVYFDAYESDIAWLRYGQEVAFSVEAYPGETFRGQIAFIEPEVNRRTRAVRVRVNVSNTLNRLKPGMFARGIIAVKMAEGGVVYVPELAGKWISPMHPEVIKSGPGDCDVCGMPLVPAEELGYVDKVRATAPLVIPTSSVLRTGKRAVVYVEQSNVEKVTYEGREVTLGPRTGDVFIVVAGLVEGERVVTNGAFKIDSALQIQAKPSMMNPAGGWSIPRHHHSETLSSSQAHIHIGHDSTATASIGIPVKLAVQLLEPYLAMQSALVADNLEDAKAQAKSMMMIVEHSGGLSDLLHNMLVVESLDALRKPHFEFLSNALIAAVKKKPREFPQGLVIMHCPMVYKDRGADWLQASEPLQNPYFGTRMLQCGRVKEIIGTPVTDH